MSYKKSINVVLNSNQKTSGNTQLANYFVDWSAFLDPTKQYLLHFVYTGGANAFSDTKLATLNASFLTNTYTNGTASSQILGFLNSTIIDSATATAALQGFDNMNLPILMPCPLNPNFSISIYDNAATPALFLDAVGAVPAPYILILRFSEV